MDSSHIFILNERMSAEKWQMWGWGLVLSPLALRSLAQLRGLVLPCLVGVVFL